MGNFTFIPTKIPDLMIIEPKILGDHRGYFMESYNQRDFFEAGLTLTFVQDNESKSTKGVLRGLHFQTKHPQGKLVRVIQGEVWDVAVDLRIGSPTFGQWEGVYLSHENKRQFYIPEGFAHGFLVTSEEAVFNYKCSDFYDPKGESGLKWDDEEVGIGWPLDKIDGIVLSEKDQKLRSLKDLDPLPFIYQGEKNSCLRKSY